MDAGRPNDGESEGTGKPIPSGGNGRGGIFVDPQTESPCRMDHLRIINA